jgi:hypothetical protein
LSGIGVKEEIGMTNEEIEKFRLGCQKVLKEMSEEEFN